MGFISNKHNPPGTIHGQQSKGTYTRNCCNAWFGQNHQSGGGLNGGSGGDGRNASQRFCPGRRLCPSFPPGLGLGLGPGPCPFSSHLASPRPCPCPCSSSSSYDVETILENEQRREGGAAEETEDEAADGGDRWGPCGPLRCRNPEGAPAKQPDELLRAETTDVQACRTKSRAYESDQERSRKEVPRVPGAALRGPD
jgi:hypothetical protein